MRANGSHSGDQRVDPAHVAAPADLVVATLTPGLAPRVLDYPVGLILHPDRGIPGGAVTDQQDPMV